MPKSKRYSSKESWALYCREYRRKNAERMRIYKREYNREWRKKNGYHNEYAAKAKYPEKQRARKLLQYACKIGHIKRGDCEICGSPKAQGHHDDYSKPLEVRWFCPLHHAEHHKKSQI